MYLYSKEQSTRLEFRPVSKYFIFVDNFRILSQCTYIAFTLQRSYLQPIRKSDCCLTPYNQFFSYIMAVMVKVHSPLIIQSYARQLTILTNRVHISIQSDGNNSLLVSALYWIIRVENRHRDVV
jgi:hypothetical protein